MDRGLITFYHWVRQTREALFAFTESLPEAVYLGEQDWIAYGSLRNIHAHVAECYNRWIGQEWMGRAPAPVDRAAVRSTTAMRAVFADVAALVSEALAGPEDLDQPLEVRVGGQKAETSRRNLILHTITHEFHHKGQLLAVARMLGHPLPDDQDADLVFSSLSS